MLVLVILAVVWAAVLVPPFVRNRRDGRPDDSVLSFRAQLSTLERATPGTTLRAYAPVGRPVHAPGPPPRSSAVVEACWWPGRRLRLLAAARGRLRRHPAHAVLPGHGVGLGLYVYALRQLQLRALAREAKVRTLRPRTQPAPILAMRRVSN